MFRTPAPIAHLLRMVLFVSAVLSAKFTFDGLWVPRVNASAGRIALKRHMAQQRAWFAEHGKFNLNLNDPLLQFDSNPEDRPKNFMIGFPRSCYRGVADWRANSVLPKASDTDLDGEALLALESRFADLGPCPELTKLESLAIWAIGDFYEGPPFHVYKGRVEGGYQELETDRKSQPTTAEVWGKITSAIAVAAGFWLLFFPPVGVRRTVIFAQNGVILVAAFAVFLGYLKFFKLFWM